MQEPALIAKTYPQKFFSNHGDSLGSLTCFYGVIYSERCVLMQKYEPRLFDAANIKHRRARPSTHCPMFCYQIHHFPKRAPRKQVGSQAAKPASQRTTPAAVGPSRARGANRSTCSEGVRSPSQLLEGACSKSVTGAIEHCFEIPSARSSTWALRMLVLSVASATVSKASV